MRCIKAIVAFVIVACATLLAQAPNPVPMIDQPLVPNSAVPGGAGFGLTVNGTGFVPTSVVNWNGIGLPTTYLGPGQLTANVPASNIAGSGTVSVTVTNPLPGGGISEATLFSITTPTTSLTFTDSVINRAAPPISVVVADFNSDGKPDLAIVNTDIVPPPSDDCSPGGTISILLGIGDGTFSTGGTVYLGCTSEGATGVAAKAGDLDKDGNTDLLITYIAAGNVETVAIFNGNGDGSFSKLGKILGGFDPDASQVKIADFNGDGQLDVAFPYNSFYCGAITIYFGGGSAGSAGLDGCTSFDEWLLVGDFNHDGIVDMAATAATGVPIFLGVGDGSFTLAPLLPAFRPMTAGDFNGDGLLDLAFSDASGSLRVFLGLGDGTFTEKSGQPSSYSDTTYIDTIDFNGDGRLDLAVANSAGAVSVYFGNGDGTFENGVAFNTGHPQASSEDFHTPVGFADFNADGRIDLVVANYGDSSVSILLQAAVGNVNPSALSFGSQNLNTTSSPQPIRLSNDGSAPMMISSVQITGDFQIQTNGCVGSLDPGSHCDVAITFTPTDQGTRLGSLTFNDTATNTPQTVSLSGIGTMAQATSTLFTSSLNPSRYGQTITLTAVVVPAVSGTPTGTVTFFDGASVLASAQLSAGTTVLAVSSLAAGNHSLTAAYSGDPTFSASTSTVLVQIVAKASVAVTLSSSLNPAYVNQLVAFSAVVSAVGNMPSGSIAFKKGTAVLATVPLVNGNAVFTTTFTKSGNFSIFADYSGDLNYFPKTSKAVRQEVNKYPTTTTLTSNPNPSSHGQPVTFTGSVSSAGPIPTGKVVFKYGSKLLGSKPLVNGVAVLTTSALPLGTLSITATFNGDTESGKSTSPAVVQIVN
jgi:hypothetical protein